MPGVLDEVGGDLSSWLRPARGCPLYAWDRRGCGCVGGGAHDGGGGYVATLTRDGSEGWDARWHDGSGFCALDAVLPCQASRDTPGAVCGPSRSRVCGGGRQRRCRGHGREGAPHAEESARIILA